MKTVYTVVGRPYAVTTSSVCTITTPDGLLIATCEPGTQVIFVAPCDKVYVSASDAHVTETFSSAASAVSGGGLKNYSIPVGSIITSVCQQLPGYLLCNGAAVSRTLYAALFAAIGTRFGAGDATSSFNLPDLRGRTLWGAGGSHPLGTTIQAGLPDIVGEVSLAGCSANSTGISSGALTKQHQGASSTQLKEGSSGDVIISLRASGYNSIYGAADTVQPPALAFNFFIKY